ncbi:hypothetical protein [Lactiplantibacillus mudanjiangensis]|uniref:Tetratricopeptide repeat protein n=1 Tax=Lactiplantibacillus mudanjiangensis TaxID=1296538 RepID=A0A660E1U9_9LACO|nr:hypothetical protein [Lactiplantibacillus mudanjiangensis]VDG26316.1 hypothetical protein MUDAN_IGPPGNFN_01663 [Lactiplantibacillus mudanjiangensis]VDG29410.1 hypothetical protein MUDAN_MDHGFNIF_00965 [Lactiplantibacillus mudanjiangensis]
MFGLFKKKHAVKKTPEKEVTPVLSTEEVSQLKNESELLVGRVDALTGDERINALNRLGTINEQLDQLDAAIDYFEMSLKEKEQFGDAYNGLLRLYEEKRKQAAYAKDDDGIQKWVTKMDDLMGISKRVLKSNY